jgi:hypothetical protein
LGYLFEPWYSSIAINRKAAIIRAYKILERTPNSLTIFPFCTAKFEDGQWHPCFDDEFLAAQPPIVLEPPASADAPIPCHELYNRLFTTLELARRDLYRELEALPSGLEVYAAAYEAKLAAEDEDDEHDE